MFDNNLERDWFLLSIEDPEFLSGMSVLKTIMLTKQMINFEFVVLNDIEGSGRDWIIFNLRKKMNHVLKLEKFLKSLPHVIQFDWGDFFLFKDYPNHWNNSTDLGYPSLIAQTDTTIRAIDDTYIYIYTPHEKIVEILKENYKIEKELKGLLKDLEHPS